MRTSQARQHERDFLTGRWKDNVAITLIKPPADTVTLHCSGFDCDTVQFCQLAKVEFAPADAVNVTTLAGDEKFAPHCVPGQLIPAGELMTVPTPVPAGVSTSVPEVAPPPPGQVGLVVSSTVAVDGAEITMFADPPVPSGALAQMLAIPQPVASDTVSPVPATYANSAVRNIRRPVHLSCDVFGSAGEYSFRWR